MAGLPIQKFENSIATGDWIAWVEEFAQAGAWVYDPATGANWWSPGVFALYETDHSISAPPDLKDHFLDGTDKLVENAIATCLTESRPWTIKARFRTCQNNIRWVISHGRMIERDGKPLLVGCFQDITETERLSRQAQQQREFLETILDNLPHMVFVKEAEDLRFVHFNKAGEKLLGLKKDSLIGRNDYDFFPQDQADHFVGKDRNVLSSKQLLTIAEEPIDTPSGQKFLRTKKLGLYNQDGTAAYLLGISEDITELKIQEELLRQQQETLAQNSRLSALGVLAGGVAHEINNPLSILQLVGDQLKIYLKEEAPDRMKIESLLEKYESTIRRIARIVRALRDISRDGRGDPFVDAAVNDIITDTLSFCQERFRAHGVRLEVVLPEVSPVTACQSVRLSQLLINLLANAFDAVQGQDEAVIRITCRQDGGMILIAVADNGPGVPQDIADSIMLPFFTTKPIGSGTGLGLSISKTIAQDHGGELSLKPGSTGAHFELTLPASTVKKEAV